MKVDFFLNGRQIHDAEFPLCLDIVGIGNAVFAHDLAGALDHALDAGPAYEHVMTFFGQHEAAGPSQRIEARISQ